MSITIQAYFNTENEAEDAKILLQTLAADMLEVGETGDDQLDAVRFIVPFGAAIGTAGTGPIHSGAGGGIANTTPFVDDLDTSERGDLDRLRYVLSGKVRDEDYEQAVAMIHRNNGYVQTLDY